MNAVARPSCHHVALTVTDLEASVEWYQGVFDIRHRVDIPHQGGVGRLLADEDRALMIVLHAHDTNDGARFSEQTTGLDHVGLGVRTRAELEHWEAHLEAHGVRRADVANAPLTHSPIVDAPYASVLVFRDPDNIQLELFAPAATRGEVPTSSSAG
ncbi:MAG: VOC family protein [Nocardioides sp.]